MRLRLLALSALTAMTLPSMAQKSTKTQLYSGNPILAGFHADPEVMYSNKTGR